MTSLIMHRRFPALFMSLCILLYTFVGIIPQQAFSASPTVTLVGSLQAAMGASSDWNPADPKTQMTDMGNGLYEITGTLPAGTYEYKFAINGSWAENYGADGVKDGGNIQLTVPSEQQVTFWFHYGTKKSANSTYYTPIESANMPRLVGNLQTALDAGSNWSPETSTALMYDTDFDNVYTFTGTLPKGTYEYKVTLGNSWAVNYGQNGQKDGPNLALKIVEATADVTFYFNNQTKQTTTNYIGQLTGTDDNIYWDNVKHDTHQSIYRDPFGAAKTGEPIRLRLSTRYNDLTSASISYWDDTQKKRFAAPLHKIGSNAQKENDYWEVTLKSDVPTRYWYHFILQDGKATAYYGDDPSQNGGTGKMVADNPADFQLTIADKNFKTPDWMKNAIVYQIFLDRFYNGDLKNDTRKDSVGSRGSDPIEHNKWTDLPDNPRLLEDKNNDGKPDWDNDGDGKPDYALAYDKDGNPIYNKDGKWSNDFYGGDLQGLREKLDYLQEIGIKTIYLNPIFNAASNHKYDTADYQRIDEMFGSKGEFIQLAKEAKDRGMTLILDGVFNHVGDDSVYFDRYGKFFNNLAYWGNDVNERNHHVGAYMAWKMQHRDQLSAEEQAKVPAWDPNVYSSPYEEWFTINSDGTYEGWWGYDSLPVIKSTNGSELNTGGQTGLNYGDFIIRNNDSVARQWVKMGSSGWRLDVAPELADSFWQAFRSYVKGDQKDTSGKMKFPNGEPIILAENWGDASSDLLGDKFDSTMNYRFRNAIIDFMLDQPFNDTDINHKPIDASELDSRLTEIYEDYPKEAFYAMMNLMDSHDTMRIKRVYGDLEPGVMLPEKLKNLTSAQIQAQNQLANNRMKLTWILQMGYPGAPTTYYGDEQGMTGYDDPDDRRSVQWDKEDKSLLAIYKKLAKLRNDNQVLKTGDLTTLYADQKTYIIGRSLVGDKDAVGRTDYITNYATNEKVIIKDVNGKAVVIVNKDQAKTIDVDVSSFARDGLVFVDKLNNDKEYTVTNGKLSVNVESMNGTILLAKTGQDLLPPNQVTDVRATLDSQNTRKVNLSWTPAADAASYEIYRSTIAGGNYERIGQVTVPGFSDQPNEPGQSYTYVVKAIDRAGNKSDLSNETTVVPYAPVGWAGNLTGKNTEHVIGYNNDITDAALEIWIGGLTNQPGPADNLVVQFGYGLKQDHSDWTWVPAEYKGEAGNNDKYGGSFTPNQVGTWYYGFRFSTKGVATSDSDWIVPSLTQYGKQDGSDDTRSVPVVANTDITAPPAAALTDSGVQNSRVSLSWIVASKDDIVAFHVLRKAADENSFREIARLTSEAASYVDTSVTNRTAYSYKVVSIDAAYNRTDSNIVSVTPNVVPVNVTFQTTVPYYTGTDFPVYLAGDLPGASWNPGAPDYQMTYKGNNVWEKTITLEEGMQIQYKYAKGSWDRVEKDMNGQEVNNRLLVVRDSGNGTMLVQDNVDRWRDMNLVVTEPANGTTTTQTQITVTGNAIPNSTVTVNNTPVTQAANGDFSTVVPLQLGTNEITVSFTADGFATATKKITVTRQ